MNQIEKVARALCDDAGCVWDHDPQALSRAEWRKAACAAIAAMPVQADPVAWMYAKAIAADALLAACEGDPADPDHPNTISITTDDFETVVRCAVENWLETHPPAQWQGIESASDAEITRLTEALRAAEEREKGLRAGLDRIAHRDPWTDPDSPERIASDTLVGAKP